MTCARQARDNITLLICESPGLAGFCRPGVVNNNDGGLKPLRGEVGADADARFVDFNLFSPAGDLELAHLCNELCNEV